MGNVRQLILALCVSSMALSVLSSPLLTTTTTPSPSADSAVSEDPAAGVTSFSSEDASDFNNSEGSSVPKQTSTPSPTGSATTTSSSPRLTRCRYEYSRTTRNEVYEVDGENLPLLVEKFIVDPAESSCYLTRQDLEQTLENSSSSEIIVAYVIGCLNRGTNITFLEEEEARELEASSTSATSNSTRTSSSSGEEADGDRQGNSSSYKRYDHIISYFQTLECRINLKGADIIANMSDLRVLSAIGHGALNLSELVEHPELCQAFRTVVAFSVISDWTAPSYLHHLAACSHHLLNVVEVDLTNDSLTSFPEVLHAALPNLRALEMSGNKLAAPVDFPWPPGFAALPRNLSRTYQFNIHYNFANSFDMPPNLFRRVFLIDGNKITNLTHFQFHSDFQYISVQRNGLREIAVGVFDDVPSLQFLSLAHNRLESLPENLFAPLVNLKRLDLQGNQLVTLPTAIFRQVRKMERLNLEQNRLQVIQDGLFSRLQELTEVKLKNNSIVDVKKEAFTTMSVKLKHLDLQNNPLKTFPVIVLLLRGLVSTRLDHTDIEVLDFVAIGRQTSVTILAEALKNPTTGSYIDLNESPTFQKTISLKNSKLRSIVLYNDTRETLPIFLLVVKYFTIQVEDSRLACDCHILNVSHQLRDWKTDGKLTGEEACLEGWKCIWPSELSGKPVIALEDEDTYCPLEEGETSGESGSGNTSCPEGCACYLRTRVNTVIVDCQNGGLRSLPEKVPERTRELWLQNNTIQNLDNRPYLPHLSSLKLSHNNVQDLPIDVLLQMPELSVLHLDDNWLTGLKPDFARLRQLRELRLAGNPFRCDCSTRWLKDWILRHQSFTEDWNAVKCTTEDAEGQVFTAVPDHQFVCKVSATLSQLAVPVAVPVSFAFLLLTAGVLAFLQRRRLKVLLYIHTGYHPFDRDPPDDRALYDVTVVCDVTARAWVLRHVIETLEGVGRYKVFFSCRDAFVGFTIAENVRHCVRNSRRMVVVVGKDWHRQELLVTAVHEALARCHKDMPHFLTVLLHRFSPKDLDNQDLRQYVHGGRYIATDDRHFAKKLLYEMPHVKPAKKPKERADEAAGQARKVQAVAGPEPIPLYDIMAVAENEHNVKGAVEGNDLGEGGGYERQASEDDVDVDLRLSGVEQYNIPIPDRQDKHPEDGQPREDDDSSDDDNNADGLEDVADGPEGEHVNGDVPHPAGLQNQMSVESQRSQLLRTVFVWYATDDLQYTLKNIVEPLETRGHTCILQDRDFPLGAAIQENIVHATENSTRCIFVLSNQTAANDWFNFAFHVAFDRHLQSPDHRVGLVSREEVEVTRFTEEIQQVIRTSSLLCEGDPWFWKRLKTFVHLEKAELG